jgi:ribose transport system substrate-binding protein
MIQSGGKKMKRIIVFALIILMAIPLTVFAGGRQAASDKPRIAVALGPANNAWHIKLREVIDEAVLRYPEFEWTVRNATDAQNQIQMLEVFRNEGFDGILIMPVDGNILTPMAESIYNAGIPTVILNRMIASQRYTALVMGDQAGGGRNAARLLGQRLNGQGNIVVLRSHAGTPIDMDRYNGFRSTLITEFPNIRIIGEGDGQFNRDAGLNAMTALLPAHPRIDAIYAQDDEAALGALVAINNARRTDIRFITGFGGMKNTYELFRRNDPVYIASMSYFPAMGFTGIDTIVRLVRGERVLKDTIIRSVAVGAWNVNEFWDDSY